MSQSITHDDSIISTMSSPSVVMASSSKKFPEKKEIRRSDRFYYRLVKALNKVMLRFTSTNVVGAENIPDSGGVLLALNHTSALDPIIVGTELAKYRPVRALAKDSLFKLPIVGWAMRKMNHIPVIRNTKSSGDVLEIAEERVRNGAMIAFYPQGTVPKNVYVIDSLKSGVSRLAAKAGVLVLPIVHVGPELVFPKYGRKLKSLLRAWSVAVKPKTVVVIGKPLVFAGDNNNYDDVMLFHAEVEKRLSAMLSELVSV